ncbi:MAG: SpoIVB peptidase [Clostridia bacterium]|nr:SpoIVB peptidase [Clostridia bacterium]
MKRFWSTVLAVIIAATISFSGVVAAENAPSGFDYLFGTGSEITEEVYLCGIPIGITIDGDGVGVIGLNEFVSPDGVCSPARSAGICIGDVITEINGIKITNVNTLSKITNESDGKPLNIKYIRDGVVAELEVTPKLDVMSKTYKLGLWAKDSSSGIGTMTYIRKNLQFGSLGHPILSQDKQIVKVINGAIYECGIEGVVKGEKGQAGELKGVFDITASLGNIYVNNQYGVYGNIYKLPANIDKKLYSVASAREVIPGKAYILTTINGDTPELFEIEIVRVFAQTTISDKGIVIRITDEKLLEITGGIVQGMSGSPIIQNGKFVGAVTHVFINDPTKGYGILAQWMLEN